MSIKVFIGKGASALLNQLYDYMCIYKFRYERAEGDPPLSQSDYILYRLGRIYEGGFIDEVKVEYDNGQADPVCFDDFISKLDESVDVKPYFEELLSLGAPIFYFAENEDSVKRLQGLPIQVFKEV